MIVFVLERIQVNTTNYKNERIEIKNYYNLKLIMIESKIKKKILTSSCACSLYNFFEKKTVYSNAKLYKLIQYENTVCTSY